MKILLLILSCFITIDSCEQKAFFKEIRIAPSPKYYNTKETTIIFPIVVTKNAQVDKLINTIIEDDMFQPEDEKQSLRNVLDEHINDYGLINLSYEITYNNFGLLSFFIDAEGCGAHCSSWQTYFNFDLTTGQKITIDGLVSQDKIDSFKNLVQADKIKSLTKYKTEETASFAGNAIDSITSDWAISQADECMTSVSIEDFSLLDNAIEIHNNCEFPYAIRSQEPVLKLKYTYKSISRFLNPEFGRLLK